MSILFDSIKSNNLIKILLVSKVLNGSISNATLLAYHRHLVTLDWTVEARADWVIATDDWINFYYREDHSYNRDYYTDTVVHRLPKAMEYVPLLYCWILNK
jgi:hypothetical protein